MLPEVVTSRFLLELRILLLHEHVDIPVVKVFIIVFESGVGGRGIHYYIF